MQKIRKKVMSQSSKKMLQTGRWKGDEQTDRAEFMEPYGRIGGPQIYAH